MILPLPSCCHMVCMVFRRCVFDMNGGVRYNCSECYAHTLSSIKSSLTSRRRILSTIAISIIYLFNLKLWYTTKSSYVTTKKRHSSCLIQKLEFCDDVTQQGRTFRTTVLRKGVNPCSNMGGGRGARAPNKGGG